ncbi:MAG: hypothetical protein KAI67_01105 [Candidatus Pacebacteria bacterium]|nr:hypothetical protein [Candidatus Paceibacterota bacterium]
MKIAICGSLDFTYEINELKNKLEKKELEVSIPLSSEKILKGEVLLEEILKEKDKGEFSKRAIKFDSIKSYWEIIKNSEVILVANFEKRGIKNYIGGNTFLEMGFAHILNKKIYLLNNVPEMIYSDEIKTMQPIILYGNLSNIITKK